MLPFASVLVEPGYRLFTLPRQPLTVALRVRLRSGKAEIRYVAMIYLRAFGDKKSLPFFLGLLESDSFADVRIRAARELSNAQFKPALSVLCKAFDETESAALMGQTTAAALQKFGAGAVKTLLKPLSKMKDEQLKVKRIHLVKLLGDNKHLDVLLPIVTSPTESDIVRSTATRVLGKYGYKRFTTDLIKILAEPHIRNSDLCLSVKDALKAFGKPAARMMVETLAKTPDADFRCNIIWALMREGAEVAIPEIDSPLTGYGLYCSSAARGLNVPILI